MSNKGVVSLKCIVKSDSSVEQRVYFVRVLQRKESSLDLGEVVQGLHRPQGRLYGVLCSWGGLLGGSSTLANLENDHGFISKEYISIDMRPFGETKNKTMRAYAQSGQYHTIVEGRDS